MDGFYIAYIPPGGALVTGAGGGSEPIRVEFPLEMPSGFADGRVITINTPSGSGECKVPEGQGLRMTYFEAVNTWILILTGVAVLLGPILAVIITRWGDTRREAIRRKENILSTLMRTRPARLSYEHVGALNLIQLEFYDATEVQQAYRDYVAELNRATPPDDDKPAWDKLVEDRHDRFVDLLHSMGRHLKYKFDKRDLQKLSYGPMGWENDENTLRMMRSLALDLMTGKQSLSVSMRHTAPASSMFPPPPNIGPPSQS